jgi:hypothetical protein
LNYFTDTIFFFLTRKEEKKRRRKEDNVFIPGVQHSFDCLVGWRQWAVCLGGA